MQDCGENFDVYKFSLEVGGCYVLHASYCAHELYNVYRPCQRVNAPLQDGVINLIRAVDRDSPVCPIDGQNYVTVWAVEEVR